MCELLVGLPEVRVLGVIDVVDAPVEVMVEQCVQRPRCSRCGSLASIKERPSVTFVDLPCFGRPARLVWRKHRWECPVLSCPIGSWTGEDPRIAAPRMGLTDRAGRWATEQVGRHGRSVSGVADDLACDWHTANDAVIAYGTALVDDDPERIGEPEAVGLDETLYVRDGPFRTQCWSTQIVDVTAGRLLDIVPGRDHVQPCAWFAARSDQWRARIRWATLDLSSSYRAVFDTMLPAATQVADPFHVVRVANTALDECRRRVQNETLGHRGRKSDPLYRCRRRLVMARERLSIEGHERLLGLLAAGDPKREVWFAWNAKEVVRQIYDHTDQRLAIEWVNEIIRDFADTEMPPEVRRLGRTIGRWRDQIVAWHRSHVSNGPTEAANNLVKRVKRAAFGFRRFHHYRIRSLLYAGAPNWDLLPTITPR
jgi:transposase